MYETCSNLDAISKTMKLNITPTFAVMLKTLARQNNAEPEEYIEELLLSEYQKKKLIERN